MRVASSAKGDRVPAGWAVRLYGALPEPGKRAIRAANRRRPGKWVRWGNLRRTRPVSDRYGWDRGLPVDRYYLERFLGRHRADIRGHVLEVKDDDYASRLGDPDQVTVIDVDPGNERADLLVDLSSPGALEPRSYDCIILTQVLQYTKTETALRNAWQALKPGGSLLVAVPALGRLDPHDGDQDRWRWTPLGLQTSARAAGIDGMTVQGFGNVLAGVCALLGLSVEDVSVGELDEADERFPLVVCGRAVAPGSTAPLAQPPSS